MGRHKKSCSCEKCLKKTEKKQEQSATTEITKEEALEEIKQKLPSAMDEQEAIPDNPIPLGVG